MVPIYPNRMTYISAAKYTSGNNVEVLIFSDTHWIHVMNDDIETAFSHQKIKVNYNPGSKVAFASACGNSKIDYLSLFNSVLNRSKPDDPLTKLLEVANSEVRTFRKIAPTAHIFMHYQDNLPVISRAVRLVAGKNDIYFRRFDEDVTAIGSGKYYEVKRTLETEYILGGNFLQTYDVLDKAFSIATFLSTQPKDCMSTLEVPYQSNKLSIKVSRKTRSKLKTYSPLMGRVVQRFTKKGLETLESTLE
jgi:hypothetical protein